MRKKILQAVVVAFGIWGSAFTVSAVSDSGIESTMLQEQSIETEKPGEGGETSKPETGWIESEEGWQYKDENGNIVKDKKDTWDIYAIFYETDEKTKTLDATNRFDHPNLISIARIDEKDRKETDEWTEFYLPFVTKTGKTVDKDKLKAGKYNVAIVFSSSIEGDYFRGAVGSTLHIDEVELIHAAD